MDYLTNYYKNLSEDLSRRLTFLEQVAGSTASQSGSTVSQTGSTASNVWTTGRKAGQPNVRPGGRKAVQTAQTRTPTEDERRRMEAQFERARQRVAEILAMSTFNKTQTTQWKPPTTEERLAAREEEARESSGLAAMERRYEELDKAALERFREEQARKQQEEQAKAEAKAEEAKKKREAYLAWKAEQEKSNK